MTKIVSLSDNAYNNLKSLKKGSESFSDVVNKLTSSAKKESLLDLAGKWSGEKEELSKIEKTMHGERKKFRLRKVEF